MIKVLMRWTERDSAGISREAQKCLEDSSLEVGSDRGELVLLENGASTHPIVRGSASEINEAIMSICE